MRPGSLGLVNFRSRVRAISEGNLFVSKAVTFEEGAHTTSFPLSRQSTDSTLVCGCGEDTLVTR